MEDGCAPTTGGLKTDNGMGGGCAPTTGDHKGPHPTPHYSRPYYTAVHIGPVYRRGEGGWDVGWWTLVVARRVLHV